MRLSVLDQSPVRAGGTPAEALANTVALARLAEQHGYRRYWLAEHHNTTSFAGSAPEIMIARVAEATSRIRVGSGGVMLSHYAPLKVAEQFRVLEALYPGRIDLGIGRAPGADPKTAVALQAGPQAWGQDAFPSQVALVRAFLEDAAGMPVFGERHPFRGVHASPRGPGVPEMWLLGSGVHSAVYAAELGLGYAHAHFIGPDTAEAAVEAYRARFRPGPFAAPQVAVACFALAAATTVEAERLAATRNLWVLQLLQNRAGPFPSPEEALAYPYTDDERRAIAGIKARGFTGTAGDVADRLRELSGALGADEIAILTITYDETARRESYRLLAEAFGIG